MRSTDDDGLGPVIRDRRRIDPVTGQPRGTGQPGGFEGLRGPNAPGRHAAQQGARPGSQAAAGPAGPGSPGPAGTGRPAADRAAAGDLADELAVAEATARLAERTADLQRVQAEYANYRKRVERDRLAVREQALANVLSALLPVLDDIGRAREHGELEGGFKSVAEALEAATVKLGLTTYGEDGEPFDPNIHEALMHSYSDEVSEPTCVRILQPGYKVGERILRPARVAVAEPDRPADEPAADQGAADQADGSGYPAEPQNDHSASDAGTGQATAAEPEEGEHRAGQAGDRAPTGTD